MKLLTHGEDFVSGSVSYLRICMNHFFANVHIHTLCLSITTPLSPFVICFIF
jgi:hypothetical protein